jgi:hypothetical protein
LDPKKKLPGLEAAKGGSRQEKDEHLEQNHRTISQKSDRNPAQ